MRISSIVYAAISIASAVAQSIPAGSQIQLHLANYSTYCLGATSATLQAPVLIEVCGAANTTFKIGLDDPTTTGTKFQLVSPATGPGTPVPFLCVTASGSQDGSAPLVMDTCEDDKFENWRVGAGEGTGEIVSLAPSDGAFCLTAAGADAGAAIEYRPCTNDVNQQWTVVVVDN
ncbi:unnamed protein product [Peniophora sp. CBMAI 1063]|nr:unnamed protein product [Peniophora sp. CBMAI 1063]